jgi:hypothetical protein
LRHPSLTLGNIRTQCVTVSRRTPTATGYGHGLCVTCSRDYTDEDGVAHTKAEQEAAYQARLDADAAKAVRDQRDRLLAETDWVTIKAVDASSDGLAVQLPQVWMVYRQALRDITDHVSFPHLQEADWPVKP